MAEKSNYHVIIIPEGIGGMRADAGLAQVLGLSRSQIAHLVESESILIESQPVQKATRLATGDMVEITFPEENGVSESDAEPVPGMEIIYHDDDIVVVDKPPGVTAHPSLGWTGLTVLGGLKSSGFHITNFGPTERRGIVHRLDAGTSGVMVVALSDKAYSTLKRAFKNRQVHKRYHALVQGHIDPASGTIDAPISRAKGNDWRFAVRKGGKDSITHYDTLEVFRNATLLDVHLETGRTHQIRVHFSTMHHPCVGDPTYGADPVLSHKLGLDRQWLHAKSISFTHPTTLEEVEFHSQYPHDLAAALDILRA